MSKIQIQCPECNATFRVVEDIIGKKGVCKQCNARFLIGAVDEKRDTGSLVADASSDLPENRLQETTQERASQAFAKLWPKVERLVSDLFAELWTTWKFYISHLTDFEEYLRVQFGMRNIGHEIRFGREDVSDTFAWNDESWFVELADQCVVCADATEEQWIVDDAAAVDFLPAIVCPFIGMLLGVVAIVFSFPWWGIFLSTMAGAVAGRRLSVELSGQIRFRRCLKHERSRAFPSVRASRFFDTIMVRVGYPPLIENFWLEADHPPMRRSHDANNDEEEQESQSDIFEEQGRQRSHSGGRQISGRQNEALNAFLKGPGQGVSRTSLNVMSFIGLFIFAWLLAIGLENLGKRKLSFYYVLPVILCALVAYYSESPTFSPTFGVIALMVYVAGWIHANIILMQYQQTGQDRLTRISNLSDEDLTVDAVLEKGLTEWKVFQDKRACTTLANALEMPGGDTELLVQAGTILLAKKQYRDARSYFERALETVVDAKLEKRIRRHIKGIDRKLP